MARTNLAARHSLETHECGRAHIASISPLNALRRSVLSCLLWEDEFYEDGQSITNRIIDAAAKVPPASLAALAREARGKHHLRHVPLLLVAVLADTGRGTDIVAPAVRDVISRADEIAELMAIRCKITGRSLKKALTHGLRRGLAEAFLKFDAYQLQKWNRDADIRLRDVGFLTHVRSRKTAYHTGWLARLLNRDRLPEVTKGGFRVAESVNGLDRETGAALSFKFEKLPTPDTWETNLSAGRDQKEVFTRLLQERKMGYLAVLRNLRNMRDAEVDPELIAEVILRRKGAEKVLPFRYVAAARAVPQFEPYLDQALSEAIAELPQLPGQTVVLVDVSRSMLEPLSAKSDLTRLDAAATLATIINGHVRLFTFSQQLVEVPARRGMAGVDVIRTSQPCGGTWLFDAIDALNKNVPYQRLIVITDEQANDPAPNMIHGNLTRLPDPLVDKAYMINVGSAKHGVGYDKWVHLDGFSEQMLRWMHEYERGDLC